MKSLMAWPVSSLQRIYPLTAAQPGRAAPPVLDLAANEPGSFQIALRHDEAAPRVVTLQAQPSKMFDIRIRRVGWVPLPRHNSLVPFDAAELDGIGLTPGYVPDPLVDETSELLSPRQTGVFWVSLVPRPDAPQGRESVRIDIVPESGRRLTCRVPVRRYPLTLAPRRDFQVIQWFYVDALLDYYRCNGFDKRFWMVLERYFLNLVDHEQDTVYLPVFTPPLDGVKRPSQLLRVTRNGKHKYRFDWRDVKRYVALARRCGIRNFEWTHFFTQWGVKNAIRIYEGQGYDEKLLWPPATGAVSPTYKRFLSAYLPELHRFLTHEKLLDNSIFHVSDEPHGETHRENYRRARGLLAELAPWMKVADALSEIEFGLEGLTDLPIASIQTATDFACANLDCGCYYCCWPRGRYLNRLLDTPLPKIRLNGWLFYRWPFKAFLHWGYNYWYRRQTREMIDPYQVSDGHAWANGWAYGDPFMVYPGPDGPVDSLRWEVFAESMRDYRLLQTLNIDRDDPVLQPLKNFEDFPKSAEWVARTRRQLLQRTAGIH